MRSAILFVKDIAVRCAVDRAVAYALFGQLWSVVAGPVSVWLIARSLTVEEQGYYYTFGSLLAVQMFFELGLTTLLVTFAAHEKAELTWTNTGELAGEPRPLARLSSLLRLSIGWYAFLAAGFALVVVPIGTFFFHRQNHGLSTSAWLTTWIGMVAATSLNLCIVPGVALLEGCGRVKETCLARLVQTLVSNCVFWVALTAGGHLLAACLSMLSGWVAMAAWLFGYRHLFAYLWRYPPGQTRVNWRAEIWPLQWKMACTWISGYFIFQLFTPVLFAYHGPSAAGRMGMSLNLVNRINGLSLTWVSTKSPIFAALVAKRDFLELDRLFFKTSAAALAVACAMMGVLWTLVFVLRHYGSPYGYRLLDLTPLALLGFGMLVSVVNFCETTYLRAYKEEPLVYTWMVFALFIGTSTYYFGRYYGALGITAAYCSLIFFSCVAVVTPFFFTRRRLYRVTLTSPTGLPPD